MYSKQQKQAALELYRQTESVSETVRILGFPTREHLYNWIYEEKKKAQKDKKIQRFGNPPNHPRNPSFELKMEAIKRCFEDGENIMYVSEEIQSLKQQLSNMQLEIDILKETITVLKKDPGINLKELLNREKTVIIDAVKSKYSLSVLLEKLGLPKSSFYYQWHIIRKRCKYDKYRHKIIELFIENRNTYEYRRIHALLKTDGIILSEKIIRKIIKEESMIVKVKKTGKYNSYQEGITPAVPNLLNRDFFAVKPNIKWLTDITEFAIPAGKIYLSPVIDCFEGLLVSWTIGRKPDSNLVNTMLDKAVMKLKPDEHPIVHSDRGVHYRWPGWIARMDNAKLIRSMSKKGYSPDNSACEGFFGRLKNEMFYNTDWFGVSVEEFIDRLNEYLIWYNSVRIKKSLGYKSPLKFRQSLGLIA